MKLGFIGLGNMGSAIAANLVRAGHEVTVWNRSAPKADALTSLGATRAHSPKSAAIGRDAVLTMLADDAALEQVLEGPEGLLEGLPADALHISMSTIGVATAERLSTRHGERRQRLLCAPVFGRPDAAAARKLFILAAGRDDDLAAAKPILDAIGQRVFHVGDIPAKANLVKLCGNFMILASIEVMAEAMALAQKGGVPKRMLLEVLTHSLFDAPVYRNYGAALVEDRFKPAGFAAPLGLKDMRLAGQSAEQFRVPMPVLSLLRDQLLQTIATAGEDTDWSAIASTVFKNAGL